MVSHSASRTVVMLSIAALAVAGHAAAQSVDFESSVYGLDKSFVGVDGWARMYKADSAVPAGNLMIRSEGGNRAARTLTTHQGSVYRTFPGASAYLDMRWRWRADNDFVHMCFGVSRSSTIDGFYPLALVCIEPSGVMEAKGAQANLLTGVKWQSQKWIYMRMVLDAPKSTFTLYMAGDSLRGDEHQIQAAAPLNDQGLTLNRVVMRSQNGVGSVDIDNIQWTPQTSLAGTVPTVVSSPRDTAVNVGGKASFRVSMAPRSGLAFQWTRNGVDVAGATDTLLTVTPARFADSGAYACRATGAWGALTTSAAKLRVLFPIPTLAYSATGESNRVNVTLSSAVAGARIFKRSGATAADLPKAAYSEYQGSFTLDKPGRLQAFATLNADTSGFDEWSFAADPAGSTGNTGRSANAPAASPGGRNFADTLRVALSAPAAGSSILYTRDGGDPRKMGKAYTGSLLLDSTATLKAVAVLGSDTSALLSETYVLVPEVVQLSPPGGTYTDRIQISLSASSPKAALYYTLDGSAPNPAAADERYSGPISLGSDAVLKVLAAAGQDTAQRSAVRTETYAFVSSGPQELKPATRLDIVGGYSLYTPQGSQTLTVTMLGSDSLGGVRGFRDIQLALRLAPTAAGAFPAVEFSSPAGERRAVYLLEAPTAGSPSLARYLGGQGKGTLAAAGVYFLAVDTLAPSVSLLGEAFVAGDSTRTQFRIDDNTSNPTVDLMRSDDARLGFADKAFASGGILSVALKNAGSSVLPLTLRVSASDRWSTASYPPESGRALFLAQKISASRRTPDLFRLDGSAALPWDLITLPLAEEPAITLDQLRSQNAGGELYAAAWDEASGGYRYMRGDEAFKAGSAVWMTSVGAPLTSLALPAGQTVAHEDGSLSVTLRKGWNQIANPTLGTLYWPISRAATPGFDQSPIKSPMAYDPAAGGYATSDSLEPWRGYFVNNKGGDTTLILRTKAPQAAGAAKASAPQTLSIGLRLRNSSLYLGAAALASDALGIEDEQSPPSPAGKSDDALKLVSARQSRSLTTDIVRWQGGALYRWSVVTRLPAAAIADIGARVESLELPEGYAAWAVSRVRGVRVRIDRDGALPAFSGFTDSLDVFAGPAALLESRLASIPAGVPAFDAAVVEARGGLELLLKLPGACRIAWSLFTPDGRALAAGSANLPSGRYRLNAGAGAGADRTPGLRVLRLDWASTDGTGSSGRLSQRIVIR